MADPVISVKLIVLYRFLSHNFPRSKTMWFLANSSIWHTKMLLNLTIPHPTTSLNVFLSQFPSFSSYLEQRTVRNTRGPFLVLFSFMKEQVFVPKTPNIFAIMTGPPSTIVLRWFWSILWKLYNPMFPQKIWLANSFISFHLRCTQQLALNFEKYCDLTEKIILEQKFLSSFKSSKSPK